MKRLRLPVLVLLIATLPACLEFDAQEVVIHHDPTADRIDALFIYRGIFAESSSDQRALDEGLGDLDKALATGEFAFWCNWPFKVDPTFNPGGVREALLRHVEVENGGLFTDPKGKLCGYQFVRVNKAAAFLDKLNTALGLAIQAGLLQGLPNDDGSTHKVDADTRDAVREFLRDKQAFLQLEGGRLELRVPCSAADHRWIKQRLETHAYDNAAREMVRREVVAERRRNGGDVWNTNYALPAGSLPGEKVIAHLRDAPSLRFFWDNDISFTHLDGLTTVTFGSDEAPQLRVTKSSDGIYHDAFLAGVRARGDKIEEGVPDQELERRFAAFHGRAAVLPPKLAELRSNAADEPADEQAGKDK